MAMLSEVLGDTTNHHIYFYSNGSQQDDSSAVRAKEECLNARTKFRIWNLSAAVQHLGKVAHYVAGMAVFGHVMASLISLGSENDHSDYENYFLAGTDRYAREFSRYTIFDGNLTMTSAYEAAISVARRTTFGGSDGINCMWMDQHFNETLPIFKGQCKRSMNDATNVVADVLHTFYIETAVHSETSTPKILEPTKKTTAQFSLTLVSICVTSFYRKRLDKTRYRTNLNTLEPLSGDQSLE